MKKRVLVIDDETDVLETLIETIEVESKGLVEIERAFNGKEAISQIEAMEVLYKSHLYHLIITDLRMPEMDGKHLIEEVKKLHPSIPILVFTGHPDQGKEIDDLMELGVVAIIKKPGIDSLMRKAFEILELPYK